jgi:hypothetical protein
MPKYHLMPLIRRSLLLSLSVLLVSGLVVSAHSYSKPELIYYRFDTAGTSVDNEAGAPVGDDPAPIAGLSIGGSGQFGSAPVGNGGSSSSNYVDTGWAPDLGSGSWTISFWIDECPTSATTYYLFGDSTASSFRCFIGGVAGTDGIILRGGGLTDVLITRAISAQPAVIHFV